MKAKFKTNLEYTFGYSRYETLIAFSNCIFLLISSFFHIISTFGSFEGELIPTNQ